MLEFEEWHRVLASQIREGLEGVYAMKPDERACVKAMVNAAQSYKPLVSTPSRGPRTTVEVDAAYLDGVRSRVEFKFGRKNVKKELADLLVVGSFVRKGALKWQRACFIQAKREIGSRTKRAAARYDIDDAQLFFLRTFPKFQGILGVYEGLKDVQLRNASGMLGAFGFLSKPGEFSVLSAQLLHVVLGGRHRLALYDLAPVLTADEVVNSQWPPYWSWPSGPEDPAHNSVTTCSVVSSFVRAWCSLSLGELWRIGATASDWQLHVHILQAIRRANAGTGKLKGIRDLMERAATSWRGNDSPPPAAVAGDSLEPPSQNGLGILTVTVSVDD